MSLRICRWLVLTFLAVSCTETVDACSVPVFRYALEQWTPDRYSLVVFHDQDVPDRQATQLESIRDLSKQGQANLDLSIVDLRGDLSQAEEWLIENSDIKQFPAFVLINPGGGTYPRQIVRSGLLAELKPNELVQSEARRKLIDHLVRGTSAVWIHLDCGIPEKDSASFRLLQQELARHQSEMTLPEIDPDDLKDLSVEPEDVRIEFQILRLSRSDPNEQTLVELLLATEPDLRDLSYLTEPMAFPIFGRGRVLYSLIGAGIQPATIEEACRFLVGACQCTVKAENPGVDLLIAYDWNQAIQTSIPQSSEITLTGLSGFQADEDSSFDRQHPDPKQLDLSSDGDASTTSAHQINMITDPADRSAQPGRTSVSSFGVWGLLGMMGAVVFIASLGVLFRS